MENLDQFSEILKLVLGFASLNWVGVSIIVVLGLVFGIVLLITRRKTKQKSKEDHIEETRRDQIDNRDEASKIDDQIKKSESKVEEFRKRHGL